jgi:hypothetical protein
MASRSLFEFPVAFFPQIKEWILLLHLLIIKNKNKEIECYCLLNDLSHSLDCPWANNLHHLLDKPCST